MEVEGDECFQLRSVRSIEGKEIGDEVEVPRAEKSGSNKRARKQEQCQNVSIALPGRTKMVHG